MALASRSMMGSERLRAHVRTPSSFTFFDGCVSSSGVELCVAVAAAAAAAAWAATAVAAGPGTCREHRRVVVAVEPRVACRLSLVSSSVYIWSMSLSA